MSHEWLMRQCNNLSRRVPHFSFPLFMWLILTQLSCVSLPRDLAMQRSWPIISANNVEQESWRTLVKIRCIIQVVVLFIFPAVIKATPQEDFRMGYTALMSILGEE